MSDNRTVQVKLNSSRVGHRFDKDGKACGMFTQQTGDIIAMDKDEARRCVNSGIAEYAKTQS